LIFRIINQNNRKYLKAIFYGIIFSIIEKLNENGKNNVKNNIKDFTNNAFLYFEKSIFFIKIILKI
jgi:hypothetical protein